jgi:hypothetical protein
MDRQASRGIAATHQEWDDVGVRSEDDRIPHAGLNVSERWQGRPPVWLPRRQRLVAFCRCSRCTQISMLLTRIGRTSTRSTSTKH